MEWPPQRQPAFIFKMPCCDCGARCAFIVPPGYQYHTEEDNFGYSSLEEAEGIIETHIVDCAGYYEWYQTYTPIYADPPTEKHCVLAGGTVSFGGTFILHTDHGRVLGFQNYFQAQFSGGTSNVRFRLSTLVSLEFGYDNIAVTFKNPVDGTVVATQVFGTRPTDYPNGDVDLNFDVTLPPGEYFVTLTWALQDLSAPGPVRDSTMTQEITVTGADQLCIVKVAYASDTIPCDSSPPRAQIIDFDDEWDDWGEVTIHAVLTPVSDAGGNKWNWTVTELTVTVENFGLVDAFVINDDDGTELRQGDTFTTDYCETLEFFSIVHVKIDDDREDDLECAVTQVGFSGGSTPGGPTAYLPCTP